MKLRYRLLWLVVFLAAYLYWTRPQHINERADDDSKTASDTTVVVRMLHSGETRAWLEEGARLFKKRHPEIVLDFTSMGSIEAIEAIEQHRVEPLIWSPSDSIDLSLLKSRLRSAAVARAEALRASAVTSEDIAKAKAALADDDSLRIFSSEGGGSPQPMLLSPLVWLGWERETAALRALQAQRVPSQPEQMSWSVVYELLTGGLGWSAPPSGVQSPAVRPVRIGYADPRRSSSGIQSLYLLTLEYFGAPRAPDVEQLSSPRYRQLIQEVSAESLSQGLTSQRLLQDMLRYGPSRLDLILTYESMAIEAIKTFPTDRWGRLKMYYPTYTVWNDHPIVQMATKPWNEEELAAARAWIAFLLSREMQLKALDFGFRPGDPNVPLERGPGLPLEKLVEAGLRLDVPTSTLASDAQIPGLLDLWIQASSSGETLEVAGPWSGPVLPARSN